MNTRYFSKVGLTFVISYLVILGVLVVFSNTCNGDWCDMGAAIMILLFSMPGLFAADLLPQAVLDMAPGMYIGISINTILLYGIGLGITKMYYRFSNNETVVD